MIIWNRSGKIYNRDIKEREKLAMRISSPYTYKFCNICNILLNILFFIITAYYFGNDLIAHATVFVCLDFILCIVDRIVFVTIPSNHSANTNVNSAQKRLARIKKIQSKLKKQNKPFRMIRKEEFLWIKNVIEREESFIESELQKIQKLEAENDTKTSKNYTNKKEYFIALDKKLDYFIKEKSFDFLKDIQLELKNLMSILDKKPIGYEMVSHKLYLYLDELVSVLMKYSDLNEQQKTEYLIDIQKVLDYLKQDITKISIKISSFETEDIEVSLAVLLKELSEGEN